MKILSVSHYYPPHVGGLEVVAQKQAESFIKEGHVVVVVTCATREGKSGNTIENGITVYREFVINFFDTHFGIPFPIPWIGMKLRLFREVRRADVVHLHDVFYITSWIAYFYARIFNKPIILTQHVAMVEHKSGAVMLIQYLVYRTIGKWIFNFAKAIIVYNRNVKNFLELEGVLMGKVIELRNGINLSAFQLSGSFNKNEVLYAHGIPTDKPIVLFVGRYVSKKGFNELYEARSNEYNIVFAGSGIVPPLWREEKGVYFIGPFTHTELAPLYRAADVFVFPAVGEIFTLVMQEAMASGLPIITTDDAGYRSYEVNREFIKFVSPDSETLRSTIREVLGNTTLAAQMRSYSLALAKKWFDWDENFSQIAQLYKKLHQTHTTAVVTTSWDDGHKLDLRLAALLKKYGIHGTFYIAPLDQESKIEDRLTDEEINSLSEDFEIGAHTMTHARLRKLSFVDARKEISESKSYLEKITNKPVVSFCYPRGEYSSIHTHMVSDLGFTLGRTVKRFVTKLTGDSYELHTSIHTYNHWSDIVGVLKFVDWNPVKFFSYYLHWDKLAIAMFDNVLKNGGVFHLWGHSWEIESHNDWDRLEQVLHHISSKKNVAYLTNGELI